MLSLLAEARGGEKLADDKRGQVIVTFPDHRPRESPAERPFVAGTRAFTGSFVVGSVGPKPASQSCMHAHVGTRSLHPIGLVALVACAGSCTMGAPEPQASLETRCVEAAEAIEECQADVPEGFFEACQHDPTEESLRAIEDIADAQCEEVPATGKADGWGESLFTSACKPAMQTGYLINRHRNGRGQSLPREEKRALRPIFGDYVDAVRVHYDGSILSEWSVAGQTIQFGSYTAQTFGANIYIKDPRRQGSDRQLALIAHEMMHTHQTARSGDLNGFFDEYCRGFYQAGFSYRDNELEKEAYELQSQVSDCLDQGDCG